MKLNKFFLTFVVFLSLSKISTANIKNNRIKKILVTNKKFDPNFHQAMSEVEDDKADPGTILQEIQAGYLLGERLLRPALVSVSKKKVNEAEQDEQKDEKNQ